MNQASELELASDVLADFGDEREDLAPQFWEALKHAYENMEFGDKAKRRSALWDLPR